MYDKDKYRKGWRYSARATGLDGADRRGDTRSTEFMDGYTDYAQGLQKWHRQHCPDRYGHQHC